MNAGGSYGASTSYARKLLANALLGYKSYTFDKTTNTLTFIMRDDQEVKIEYGMPTQGPQGERGPEGPRGIQGPRGLQGPQGEKGETGFSPKVSVEKDTESEYVLAVENETGSFNTPNLKGVTTRAHFGVLMDTDFDNVLEVPGSKVGDIYVNKDTFKYYLRTDKDNNANYWEYKGCAKGANGKDNYELALETGFVGTKEQFIESLAAEATEVKIVNSKPSLFDENTRLQTMYYYQVDGNAPGTAWKYRGEVPDTMDYPPGKYSYFNGINYFVFELAGGEGKVGILASTLKDTYSFYVVFDSLNMTIQCHKVNKSTLEDTALGHPEPVTSEPTKPEDSTLIEAPLEPLGVWHQTIYIGSSKETAQDCTLATGAAITGVITTEEFIRFIGTEELTCEKKQIRPAINDLYNAFALFKELVPTNTEVDKKLENYVKEDAILLAKSDEATDEEVYSAKLINSQFSEMKQNFQGGVDTVYNAVVEKGTTPVDKSPSEIAIAIRNISSVDLTVIYDALTNKGLPMTGTEQADQVAAIITDLLSLKSYSSRINTNTFVFNGMHDVIKDTDLADTSGGLVLNFASEELTSTESDGYVEFAEIDKTKYNQLKFM